MACATLKSTRSCAWHRAHAVSVPFDKVFLCTHVSHLALCTVRIKQQLPVAAGHLSECAHKTAGAHHALFPALLPLCRGDVQPYGLLGVEIQSRGHDVVVATESRMQGLVEQLGHGLLGYHCICGDPTGMLYEKKYQVGYAQHIGCVID